MELRAMHFLTHVPSFPLSFQIWNCRRGGWVLEISTDDSGFYNVDIDCVESRFPLVFSIGDDFIDFRGPGFGTYECLSSYR